LNAGFARAKKLYGGALETIRQARFKFITVKHAEKYILRTPLL